MKELSQTKIGYLLDTNILIFLLRKDASIAKRVLQETQLYTSIIVLGELHYGAEHSTNVVEGLSDVNEIQQTLAILIADSTTASIYGRIRHEQAKKGQMLPDNDLWIAATALQYGLTLVTRDHHFTWITDLILEQW